jgi:hypothetical protein
MRALTVATLLTAVLLLSMGRSASAEGNCPPGYYQTGQTDYVGCAPLPSNGEPSDSNQTPKRNTTIVPAPAPPKGWKPLWFSYVEFENADGVELYELAYNKATREEAEQAVKDRCEKLVQYPSAGLCVPSTGNNAYLVVFKWPDGRFSWAASNNYYDLTPNPSSCETAREAAQRLGWVPEQIGDCPIERIEDIANGIFPPPKAKKQR